MASPLNNQLINVLPLMNNLPSINNNCVLQDAGSSETLTNDTNELNESNPYFLDFKENIRQWIKMDDDIITLNNALKDIKKKKQT